MTTRERIERRARGRCEYCQASQEICGYTFHIGHIVSKKRGGADTFGNYAFSCAPCNLFKGDWLTGIDPETETEESLFNPRAQKWRDHFEWSTDFLDVLGKNAVGPSHSLPNEDESPHPPRSQKPLARNGCMALGRDGGAINRPVASRVHAKFRSER